MPRRRIYLESLALSDRAKFVSELAERFSNSLVHRFPADSGYVFNWHQRPPILCTISRGNFWGLLVQLRPLDTDWRVVDFEVSTTSPILQQWKIRYYGIQQKLYRLPGIAKLVGGHFLLPLLLFPVILLIPLIAIYRVAMLRYYGEAAAVLRSIDDDMTGLRSLTPGNVRVGKPLSREAILLVSFLASTAVMFICTKLAFRPDLSENSTMFFGVVAALSALLSVALLSGLAMTLFEMDNKL